LKLLDKIPKKLQKWHFAILLDTLYSKPLIFYPFLDFSQISPQILILSEFEYQPPQIRISETRLYII